MNPPSIGRRQDARFCKGCNDFRHITHFDNEKEHPHELMAKCRDCAKAEEIIRQSIVKRDMTRKEFTQLWRASLKGDGSKKAPDISDLAAVGIEQWGGVEEFMREWKKTIVAFPHGTHGRANGMRALANLVEVSSRSQPPQVEAEDMSDEDIDAALMSIVSETMTNLKIHDETEQESA